MRRPARTPTRRRQPECLSSWSPPCLAIRSGGCAKRPRCFICRIAPSMRAGAWGDKGGDFLLSWGSRAHQAIVDRFTKSIVWNRHHGDARGAGAVELAQMRKQIGGRLDQIAARREVEDR